MSFNHFLSLPNNLAYTVIVFVIVFILGCFTILFICATSQIDGQAKPFNAFIVLMLLVVIMSISVGYAVSYCDTNKAFSENYAVFIDGELQNYSFAEMSEADIKEMSAHKVDSIRQCVMFSTSDQGINADFVKYGGS